MIDAMTEFMLWDGVAIMACLMLGGLGLFRWGTPLPTMLLAGCIPAANLVIEVGYYFYWWECQGFMSFTTMFVLAGVLLLLLISWIGMDGA